METIWAKRVGANGGNLWLKNGCCHNNKIYLTGNFSQNNGDIAVLALDYLGNIDWLMTYGGYESEGIRHLSESNIVVAENSLFINGFTESFHDNSSDVYFIKSDLNGNSGCNETELTASSSFLTPSYFDIDISMNHTLNISDNDGSYVNIDSMPILTICPSEISAEFSAPDTIVCKNESISFYSNSTNNDYNYQWFFPGGAPSYSNEENPPEVQYNTAGQYDVTLVVSDDFNQDTLTKHNYIRVAAIPNVELGLSQSICKGEYTEVGIEDISGYDYLWSNGETTSSISVDEAGKYVLTVINDYGCYKSDSVIVNVYPKPAIDSLIINDNGITIVTDSLYEYSIDNSPWTNSEHLFIDEEGTHNLEIRNSYNCLYDTSFFFKQEANLIIPNFITPNGDNIHDKWIIEGIQNYQNPIVKIYNRNWKILIEYNGNKNAWDGTVNNKPLPSDTYWYQIYIPEMEKTYTGDITIIR